MNNKIIFWDMDGTLGFFEQALYRMEGKEIPKYVTAPFGPKEGIEELLTELNSQGFDQYITTSGASDYVDAVMKETGINKYFKDVFARDKIDGVYGPKQYNEILQKLGVSILQAKSDVLIIGNSFNDVPSKTSHIVSIIDENNWMRNSKLTRKIIDMLIQNGDGDFNKGFHVLYDNAKKVSSGYKHLAMMGKIILENEVELYLKFMQEKENESGAPVFLVGRADKYYSKIITEHWKKMDM